MVKLGASKTSFVPNTVLSLGFNTDAIENRHIIVVYTYLPMHVFHPTNIYNLVIFYVICIDF